MKGRTLIGYQGNNFFYVSATVKYNKNPTSYPRIIDWFILQMQYHHQIKQKH